MRSVRIILDLALVIVFSTPPSLGYEEITVSEGGSLKEVVTLIVDKEYTVTIKTKGRDKGSKPWGRVPKEVVITVVSRSEISLQDPKHGKMVFYSKRGLIGEAQR